MYRSNTRRQTNDTKSPKYSPLISLSTDSNQRNAKIRNRIYTIVVKNRNQRKTNDTNPTFISMYRPNTRRQTNDTKSPKYSPLISMFTDNNQRNPKIRTRLYNIVVKNRKQWKTNDTKPTSISMYRYNTRRQTNNTKSPKYSPLISLCRDNNQRNPKNTKPNL